MNDKDRIRLAEAMGWKRADRSALGLWVSPDGKLGPLPDPENDANDTEALIRWLRERGHSVEITLYRQGFDGVCFYNKETLDSDCPDQFTWEGDDWKRGVCELALKVIDDE